MQSQNRFQDLQVSVLGCQGFYDEAGLVSFPVKIPLSKVAQSQRDFTGRAGRINAKPASKCPHFLGFLDFKQRSALGRRPKRLDGLLSVIVICGGPHDISQ